jgi:hypothetical protein
VIYNITLNGIVSEQHNILRDEFSIFFIFDDNLLLVEVIFFQLKIIILLGTLGMNGGVSSRVAILLHWNPLNQGCNLISWLPPKPSLF